MTECPSNRSRIKYRLKTTTMESARLSRLPATSEPGEGQENFTTSAPMFWEEGNSWQCPHLACSVRFTRKADTLRHFNAVHKQNGIVCPIPGCNRLFSRPDKLLEHRRKHHSSRDGSSMEHIEKDTDINTASSGRESMPELGYESPSSENPKSDPLLLSKDWEAHRARLEQLYQSMTLPEVIDIMKRTHGFQARHTSPKPSIISA